MNMNQHARRGRIRSDRLPIVAGRVSLALAFALAAFVPGLGLSSQGHVLAAGTTYYVDCNTGRDTNTGTSAGQAWRSLAKANAAPLGPGDQLRFLRGCTWTGTFRARWNGTAAERIVIGAYGSGTLPKVQNGPNDASDGYHVNVDITGSYQTIQNIQTAIVNPPVSAGCGNNPLGWFVGFNFRGSYNILRYAKATRHTAGAILHLNTHNNKILNSQFTSNNAMQVLTPRSVSATDDLGAWGILLKGSNQEVAHNYFANNNALCTYDTPPQGNSVELYEARDNRIHHNTSVNDRDFSELGGSATIKSDTNTFAYNLVISSIPTSHFIIARGSGTSWGPTYRTKLLNNTVYYTGAQSEGIVCGAHCSRDVLTAKNNIIWAEQKAAFADGPFYESNNVYWNSSGEPFVQFINFSMSASSRTANPRFIDAAGLNFRLLLGSPAINAGVNLSSWTKDLDGTFLPQQGIVDIGAYEHTE